MSALGTKPLDISSGWMVSQIGFVLSSAGIRTIHEMTRNGANKALFALCDFGDRFTWQGRVSRILTFQGRT
jgi:hypothetical protein